MNKYKELKIWTKGMEIVNEIYSLTRPSHEEEKYVMRSQMIRAAVSIPANIAEGTSRRSQNDFARFIEISLGSCFEPETHTLIAKWNHPGAYNNYEGLFHTIDEEQKILNSFCKKLSEKETKD